MIRRPLTVASTVVAMALLGAPSALANTGYGDSTAAAATCTGSIATTVGTTSVTVSGTVHCSADANLAVRTSAQVGPATVKASSAVYARANTDVKINATVPVVGCTG